MTYILVIFFLFTSINSQTTDEFFKRGMKAYMDGDIITAISDLDKAHSLDPKNEKITSSLAKLLTIGGETLFKKGELDDARRLFRHAVSLGYSPAEPLYREVTSKLEEIEAKRKREKEELERARRKKIEEMVKKEEEPLETTPASPSILPQPVASVQPGLIKPLSQQLQLLIVGILILLVVVIILTYVFTSVTLERSILKAKSDEVRRYQEIILRMLSEKQMLTEKEKKIIISLPGTEQKYQEVVVISPEARRRAKRIEIIEQALKDEKDPEVAESLIGPFLEDSNNRVRANAAKAIYKFNKKLCMDTLKGMFETQNKWMIISACWVLEQIKDPDGMKYLIKFINDKDQHVRNRAYKAVETILASCSPKEIEKIKKEIPEGVEFIFERA